MAAWRKGDGDRCSGGSELGAGIAGQVGAGGGQVGGGEVIGRRQFGDRTALAGGWREIWLGYNGDPVVLWRPIVFGAGAACLPGQLSFWRRKKMAALVMSSLMPRPRFHLFIPKRRLALTSSSTSLAGAENQPQVKAVQLVRRSFS